MRRMIRTLVACAALLAGAAPAQAVTKEPVQALKAVLAPGHGMHFTETSTLMDGLVEQAERRRKGVFEFNAKGWIKALDVTTTGGEHGRERVIGFNHAIGGTSYRSGGLIGEWLKKGETWWEGFPPVAPRHTELLGYDEQLVNPAEPATLAALLKNGQRSGTPSPARSPSRSSNGSPAGRSSRPTPAGMPDTKLAYTVTLTSAGLVSRVQSTYTLTDGLGRTGGQDLPRRHPLQPWGGKVSIKAPDPRETTTELCIGALHWRLPG